MQKAEIILQLIVQLISNVNPHGELEVLRRATAVVSRWAHHFLFIAIQITTCKKVYSVYA